MHDANVRVSYLMVTRNRGTYLSKALQNIREFITPEDELIIVDGGSTDDTKRIAAENADIISVFLSEPDRGEGHAVNKGLALIRGRYVKFVTDDDYFYPDAMNRLIEVMEENAEVQAIQCGGENWHFEGAAPVFTSFRRLRQDCASGEDIVMMCSGLGLILRREVIALIGGVSPTYRAVDLDISCKILEAGCRFAYLDINLFRWYVYPHSGFQNTASMTKDRLRIQVRLKQWDSILAGDTHLLMEALELSNLKYAAGFIRATKMANVIRRSRVGWVLEHPVSWLFAAGSLVRSWLSPFRRPPIAGDDTAAQADKFTGRLLLAK